MYLDPLKELAMTEGNLDGGDYPKGTWVGTASPNSFPRGWKWIPEDKAMLWSPCRALALDIDEVMTNRATASRDAKTPTICPTKVAMVAELCERFDLKVFLCSTWADFNESPTARVKLLEAMGFPKRFILWGLEHYNNKVGYRGINLHNMLTHPECNHIVDLIIIDDSQDYLPYQLKHLVHVSALDGFTVTDFEKIEAYFGADAPGLAGRPNSNMGPRDSDFGRGYYIRNQEEYSAEKKYFPGDIVRFGEFLLVATKPVEPYTPLRLTGASLNVRLMTNAEIVARGHEDFMKKQGAYGYEHKPVIFPENIVFPK